MNLGVCMATYRIFREAVLGSHYRRSSGTRVKSQTAFSAARKSIGKYFPEYFRNMRSLFRNASPAGGFVSTNKLRMLDAARMYRRVPFIKTGISALTDVDPAYALQNTDSFFLTTLWQGALLSPATVSTVRPSAA